MTSADDLKEKLDDLWKKALPLMLRRLEVISRAHRALTEGALTDAVKEEAAQEAHKLAGSLGVFGLQGGSEAALEIEQLLSAEHASDKNAIAELDKELERLKRQVESR